MNIVPPITEQHDMTPYQQDALHPEGAGVYGGLVIGVVGPTGAEKRYIILLENLSSVSLRETPFLEKLPDFLNFEKLSDHILIR